jgi:hypothetical protein
MRIQQFILTSFSSCIDNTIVIPNQENTDSFNLVHTGVLKELHDPATHLHIRICWRKTSS